MNNNVVVLIGRILLSALFIMSGVMKLADPAATAGMVTQAGLPMPMVLTYLAGIFELAAGLGILVGFYTSLCAYALAAFCIFTAFVFHGSPIAIPGFSDGANGMLSVFNQIIMMKNITLAGGFLVLAAFGAGTISVDARRANKD